MSTRTDATHLATVPATRATVLAHHLRAAADMVAMEDTTEKERDSNNDLVRDVN